MPFPFAIRVAATIAVAGAMFLLPAATIAAVPFADSFGSAGPSASWVPTTGTATISTVVNGTNSIPASSGSSDGYFGRIAHTGEPTHSVLAGDNTDADYVLETKIFVPVGFFAYFYRIHLYFYEQSPASGGVLIIDPSAATLTISLVASSAGQSYTKTWVGGTDFIAPASTGWRTFRIELQGTSARVFMDEVELPGGADWTSSIPAVNSGKFGYGQHNPSTGTFTMSVDDFSVSTAAGIDDWALYE